MMPNDKERFSGIQFVYVNNPDTSKPTASCTTKGRSHVMKKYHQRKQIVACKQKENFRHTTAQQIRQKHRGDGTEAGEVQVAIPRDALALGNFDPFSCLAADTTELPVLLGHPSARRAGAPVINFSSEFNYQALHIVYRSSLADPALLNAILMALTLAIKGEGSKFLSYKGETLRWINERLEDRTHAATAATIGAVLFVIGVDARLGKAEEVDAHKRGLNSLIQLCRSQATYLHDGIKRAIFWQDLNSAVLIGSPRFFSHGTFSEIGCNWHALPRPTSQNLIGFGKYFDLLGSDFFSIVEGIKVLQGVRESTDLDLRDAISVMHLDNQQASIESRLYDLGRDPVRFANPVLYCCIHAAYLYTYRLFTEIWCSNLIPSRLSHVLLEHLRDAHKDNTMSQHWDIFAWIISMGGTFTTSSSERTEFASLLLQCIAVPHDNARFTDVLSLLRDFLWSEKLFQKRWDDFWQLCNASMRPASSED